MGILDAPITPAAIGALSSWKANTAYTAGQFVISPYGDTVKVATAHTSGTIYDAAKFVLVRTDALRKTHMGFAGRDYAPVDLVFWGTSMTEGGPLSGEVGPTYRWRRWLDKLQTNLRARLPLNAPVTGSIGYIPAFFNTFFPGGTSTTIAGGTRAKPEGVSYSSTALVGYGSGLGNRSLGLAASGDWVEFTFTGDAFDLFLSTHTTASPIVAISVDGGAATNYTLPAQTLKADRYRVTGLTVGSHTVRATFNTSTVVVDGLMPYNGDRDKGIRVWDAGKGSAKIGDIGSPPSNGFRGFQQMGIINPALIGVEWGFNEYFGNVTSATFKTNLTAFVSSCAANVTGNPTFLFIIWPQPQHSGTPVEAWANYVQVIREVAAATTNSVIVDFSERLPAYTDNSLGFFYDNVHPTDKGSAYVADVLASVLVPR